MDKVFLISCSKKKRDGIWAAKFLYDKSAIFKKSYIYAKMNTDKIYILSTKYGLIKDSDVIETYEINFSKKENGKNGEI